MISDTQPAKGYYSILQFVPDLERAEGANVGIVLFCPEKRFLDIVLAGGNDPVRRIFRRQKFDFARLDLMKEAFAERIRHEASQITNANEFKKFIDTRANQLILTEPRSIKVFNPMQELENLAERLVGFRHHVGVPRRITPQRIVHRLQDEFRRHRLDNVIATNIELDLPFLHKTESYPFAFKNGIQNAIKPVVFPSDTERIRDRASIIAVEGSNLTAIDWKLNVVAGFNGGGSEQRKIAQDILSQFNVKYYEDDKLEDFLKDVAQSAH